MNTRKNNNKSSQSSTSSSSFNSQLSSPNQFTSNNNMLSPHEFEISIKHMNDRLYYGLLKSIGGSATITLASDNNHNGGNKVTGILHTVSELNADGAFSIVLKYPVSDLTVYNNETLIIYDKDILLCDFNNIDFNPNIERNSENNTNNSNIFRNSNDSKKGFRTDTDISGNKIIKERELQKWSPDEGDDDLLPSLDDDIPGSSNHWDQFEVNKSKFGIESTYDETLYTTKVSTDAPDFQERLKEADRLAKEIESQGYNGNMHLAEERGIQVDDSGVDEEDKYSGVLRENKANEKLLMGMLKSNISNSKSIPAFKLAVPGQYVPPNQRAAQYHQDPAVISSSAALPPKPKTSTSPTSSASTSTSSTTTSATTNTKPQSAKSNNNPNAIPKKPTTSKSSESQSMKKEIEDLKKFSTNLKISSEMPSDVASIIHKDKIEHLSSFVPSPKSTAAPSTVNAQQSYRTPNQHPHPPAPLQLQHKHHQAHQHPIQQQPQMNSPMLNQFQQTTQHNYSINQNQQQQQQQQNSSYQQRHKRNLVSFFGPNRIPSEDGPPRNVLNLTFNILISAKNEFIQKNRNNKDILEKTIIIPIDKPFNTQPVWPKTIDKPFEDFFSKEEEMPPQVMNSMPRNMFPMMNPAPIVMSPPMMDQHPQTSHNMPSHNPYQAYNTMPAANPYMYPFQMPMVMIQQPVPGQNYSYVPPVYQPNAHMPAHMQHGGGNNGRRFHQNHNNKHVNSNNFR